MSDQAPGAALGILLFKHKQDILALESLSDNLIGIRNTLKWDDFLEILKAFIPSLERLKAESSKNHRETLDFIAEKIISSCLEHTSDLATKVIELYPDFKRSLKDAAEEMEEEFQDSAETRKLYRILTK